jgi:hypothetical protein
MRINPRNPMEEPPGMSRFSVGIILAALFLSGAATGKPQTATTPSPSSSPLPHLSLTASDLIGLPRRTVTVTDETGQTASYSGVDLGALLAKNGAPNGAILRGRAIADYVIVRAADGYRSVFALCELDPAFTSKIVLLADQRNGAPMGTDVGPFRIVIPDEKRHARWVRKVIELDVMTVP